MTLWQRFYLWMGGTGPHGEGAAGAWEPWWDATSPWLPGTADPLGFMERDWPPPPPHYPSLVGELLKRLGFLKRDPDVGEAYQALCYCMKWQWRFWRGPYRDAALACGLNAPSYWSSWRRWR